jgi:hypothetical protein
MRNVQFVPAIAVKMYVGQTRSRALIAELSALGWGEMTQPDEWPPRRQPWALDNGAFKAWRGGEPFDGAAFLDVVRRSHGAPPDFVVCPDIVAGGAASLALSLGWARILAPFRLPLALVVQDGMGEPEVLAALGAHPFVALFVGGSMSWKLRTGAAWVALAHAAGIACHVGRVGTGRRIAWARRIGADSVDSCLPLWSADNLARAVGAALSTQLEIWTEEHPAAGVLSARGLR